MSTGNKLGDGASGFFFIAIGLTFLAVSQLPHFPSTVGPSLQTKAHSYVPRKLQETAAYVLLLSEPENCRW